MEERLKEFLFSEGFASYAKLQAEVGATFVKEIWKKDVSPEYVRGVMDGMKKIIKIPANKATAPEEKQALLELEAAVFRELEVRFYPEIMNAD